MVTGLGTVDRVAPRRHAVCFEGSGTPRQALHVECCERAEAIFPDLADQDLALCLEAARHGGVLWVDPRDGDLWWVRRTRVGGRPTLAFRSAARTLTVPVASDREPGDLDDADLAALVARATAA